MNIEKIIKENQGTIVDVRTPQEFFEGNVVGSINVPLQEIDMRLEEIKKLKTPLVLCCASGARSNAAYKFLTPQGIDCYDAGTWLNVNYYKSKAI